MIRLPELIKRLRSKHPEIDCSMVKDTATNSSTEVFKCVRHGEFQSTFSAVTLSKYGCRKCASQMISSANRKSLDYYISQFRKHNHQNYLIEYKANTNRTTKLNAKCKLHGWFITTLGTLISGSGCVECGKERSGLTQRKPTEKRILEFRSVHGNLYDYSLVPPMVKSNKVKIPIVCKEHGIFHQRVNDHAAGKGCFKCSKNASDKSYVSMVKDGEILVCLKYGIAKNINQRTYEIQSGTSLTVLHLIAWQFKDEQNCYDAERYIKENMTPYLPKSLFKNGFTETCRIEHLQFIIDTFERFKGVRI